MAGVVADVEVAVRIERHMLRVQESSLGRRPSVAVVPAETQACFPAERRPSDSARIGPTVSLLRGVVVGALAGEQFEYSGFCVDPANVVIPLAGQEDIAIIVDGYSAGGVELCFDGRTALAATPLPARPREGRDDTGFVVDAAIRVVPQVREVEITVFV